MFVKADTGIEGKPAIALYTKLGKREDVLHFDIAVEGSMESNHLRVRESGRHVRSPS